MHNIVGVAHKLVEVLQQTVTFAHKCAGYIDELVGLANKVVAFTHKSVALADKLFSYIHKLVALANKSVRLANKLVGKPSFLNRDNSVAIFIAESHAFIRPRLGSFAGAGFIGAAGFARFNPMGHWDSCDAVVHPLKRLYCIQSK